MTETKEQILARMDEIMPFSYSEKIRPYILEAMQIHADKQLILSGVSKRYFLFECVNADKQKLRKLIIAPDRETAIADIETNYLYIIKWYSSEELNVC